MSAIMPWPLNMFCHCLTFGWLFIFFMYEHPLGSTRIGTMGYMHATFRILFSEFLHVQRARGRFGACLESTLPITQVIIMFTLKDSPACDKADSWLLNVRSVPELSDYYVLGTIFDVIISQLWPHVTVSPYPTNIQECHDQYFIFHLDSVCPMLRITFNIFLSPSLIFPFYYVTRSFCNLANKMHFPDSRLASFLLQGLTRHFTLKVWF